MAEDNIVRGANFKSPMFVDELDQTLGEYLLKTVKTDEDRDCMIDATTSKKITTHEIINRSVNLAIAIQNLGCDSDTVVGIISQNCLEYMSVVLAANLAGAIVTCFNPLYTKWELEHTFRISHPSIVFCSSNQYQKIKKTNEAVLCVKHIILLDTESDDIELELQYSELILPSYRNLRQTQKGGNDTALILYSSGTTGFSKGVLLCNRNVIFFLKLVRDENLWDFYGKFTVGVVPMFHVYGLVTIIQTMVINETLVFLRKFDEKLFLTKIQEYKAKYLFLVPPLLTFLLKSSLVDDFDLSSVEEIISGGAPLDPNTEEKFRKKFNVKHVRQGFGMTESILITLPKKNRQKLGCCGCPLPGTQLKVVDVETGNTLGICQTGEIRIKGPNIMKGYKITVEEIANPIDNEGWLPTGDLGYYDKDGDVFIIDRLKELIKYNGYQVAPAELENLLLKHPDVDDAAVVGKPDRTAGEVPTAFVVRRVGSNVTEQELVEYIAELVSPQKKLRGGVIFTSTVPRNPSGKILRRNLKENLSVTIENTENEVINNN